MADPSPDMYENGDSDDAADIPVRAKLKHFVIVFTVLLLVFIGAVIAFTFRR